ncbi:hypothetical protein F8388_012880 [Cannabis sativa]|uniref:Uncharacterized protein n=1 Tax=Cannabis sativa TaxID=3483 RepID=A0A7J6EUR8_CANSA|nr:hypothetical protein G4B88_022244 [Cannabis sativa]KAF4361420.1 hypothetical protein F8388_012880 [Cannabis sativa]
MLVSTAEITGRRATGRANEEASFSLASLSSDMGTEYLVRPVGRAEDEEDASDFEPEENGEEEDYKMNRTDGG